MSSTTQNVEGVVEPRFAGVLNAFARNLAERDVGASFAVFIEGRPVVDIWGGYLDETRTRKWERDTLVNVFSSTKTMSFLCALKLADRGQLDLRAPVSRYWPEFAENGKQNIEVRHLLSHSSGVPAMDLPLSEALLYDHDAVCRQLATQPPWWKPGTASGYHALIQGHLIGEVVRRITGKSLGQYFREEWADPIGADFHIGLAPRHFDRVANLIPPTQPLSVPLPAPGSVAERVLLASAVDPLWTRTAAWRRAEIPAANGHGNARAMAKIHSVLACGGEWEGRSFLSPRTCESVLEEQCNGVDLVIGVPVRFGLGYALQNETFRFSPNDRVAFWGGWGGSLVMADLDAKLSLGFAMNQMSAEAIVGDQRTHALCEAVYAALK
jgi:CubicO group peptidase (beta-lactamase class C family)